MKCTGVRSAHQPQAEGLIPVARSERDREWCHPDVAPLVGQSAVERAWRARQIGGRGRGEGREPRGGRPEDRAALARNGCSTSHATGGMRRAQVADATAAKRGDPPRAEGFSARGDVLTFTTTLAGAGCIAACGSAQVGRQSLHRTGPSEGWSRLGERRRRERGGQSTIKHRPRWWWGPPSRS